MAKAAQTNYGARGLRRGDAAAYVGIGPTKFDELVSDGRMPQPRTIDSIPVWDRPELDMSFEELPRRKPTNFNNPWDSV